jgi:hypothetical protein
MNSIKRLLLIWAAALVPLFASGSASAATPCSGVLSGTISDGVVVWGGFCQLQGANVSGGVQVMAGSFVVVCGSTIKDGFTSDGAANLIFGAEEVNCDGNVFNGTVRISNTGPGVAHPAPSIALERSTFNGGVVLMGNQGDIVVSEARIAGGLWCSNNVFDLGTEGNQNMISGKVTCKFK